MKRRPKRSEATGHHKRASDEKGRWAGEKEHVLLEQLSVGVCKVSLDEMIIETNRALADILGYENALQAMPNGGDLTISSKQSNSSTLIAFADTGEGISSEVMNKLGRPLVTTKSKGMGLGLAICKRIVEAHGGAKAVESKVGEGTTITVTLPNEQEGSRSNE